MRKLGTVLVLFALAMGGLTLNANAQFNRDLDPITVLGSECGDLLNLSSAGIRVYVYDAEAGTWAPIPFQVDDFYPDSNSDTGKKVEWDGNGTLEGVDEIVFMGKDLGDQAADVSVWPDDMESKNHSRYEIVILDPVSGLNRYAYIYYSSTLSLNETSYISYQNDRVLGASYTIGHDTDDAGGMPDSLAIAGNNVDILDGWRVRAHIDKIVIEADLGAGKLPFTGTDVYFAENMDEDIKLSYGFITVTVHATAFHEKDSLKVKSGPIRVIREHTLAIRFSTTGLVDTSRIPITTLYYDKSVEFKPAFSLNLGDDVKELDSDFISFSAAFNQNSTNVKFYGDGFVIPGSATQDSLIDRNPENQIYKKELTDSDWPGKHWFGYSGQPTSFINNATFFTIAELNGARIAPDRTPALFYYDYKMDDHDPAGIFGVSGLRIYDWSKSYSSAFDIDARFRKFYLAQNSTHAEMQALFDIYSNPPQTESVKEAYPDEIPPALITDLAISGRTDTSATLTWTAVGDDGMTNGPAKYYVVRYSTVAPANPDGNDWAWWGAGTTMTVPNVPAPGDPGTTETLVVNGLSEAVNYYFRINVADDAGNASGLSNTASGSTTPVELAAFTANVLNSRRVLLKWSTASETNNLGFAVERKFANTKEWSQIGFVKGAGTTVEAKNYSYLDEPNNAGDWFYRLKQVDAGGDIEFSDAVAVSVAAPQEFVLNQNYPNPFNPTTTISFQVPESAKGEVMLVIYDMLGRKVRTLMNEAAKSGYYDVQWDGMDDNGAITASGIYFYNLRAGEFASTRKMIKMQ